LIRGRLEEDWGRVLIRLRLNTLQLVGVKRKSRQRGCGELPSSILKLRASRYKLRPDKPTGQDDPTRKRGAGDRNRIKKKRGKSKEERGGIRGKVAFTGNKKNRFVYHVLARYLNN